MGRAKSEFVVLGRVKGTDKNYYLVIGGLGSTEEARVWLKKNGKESEEYQIAAFSSGPITIHIEKTYRRTLVAAALPPVIPKAAKGTKKD